MLSRCIRSTRSLPFCLLGLLLVPQPASAETSASGAYPEDPFQGDYDTPVAREVGTAAGQLRFFGSVGYDAADSFFLQGTYEHMTLSYLGLRVSGCLDVRHPQGEPGYTSLKTGPMLQLLPYHPIDIGFFTLGGVSRVSLDGGDSTWMPEISPGVAVDIHLHSYWAIRFEGQYIWGIYADGDGNASRHQWVGFFGLGLLL